jgi:hypothetical protein
MLATEIGVPIPGWAKWNSSRPSTIGIEEEVMRLDPLDQLVACISDAFAQ